MSECLQHGFRSTTKNVLGARIGTKQAHKALGYPTMKSNTAIIRGKVNFGACRKELVNPCMKRGVSGTIN